MRNVLIAMLLITLVGCNQAENGDKGADWFARIMAILALFVSILLGVINHWWDRQKWNTLQAEKEAERKAKEEAKRQRVKATLGVNIMENVPVSMTVEIVSLCDFQIPLEKV